MTAPLGKQESTWSDKISEDKIFGTNSKFCRKFLYVLCFNMRLILFWCAIWYRVYFEFQPIKFFGGQNFCIVWDFRHFCRPKYCPIRYSIMRPSLPNMMTLTLDTSSLFHSSSFKYFTHLSTPSIASTTFFLFSSCLLSGPLSCAASSGSSEYRTTRLTSSFYKVGEMLNGPMGTSRK